ncbi:DMT family transporter [Cognatishimia sp. F0-27]|uniref:DMT family transporter n=1 Tax=Cognatishimia sp. F0-27 TaxID=2816855 RepID=UPI001D0C2BFE|nr:DMT family transporter [Cognatishimia sp. F0-27]MCC1492370.1 DMT family transporter [Cognatishimia sp. F0-27]
MQTLRAIGLMVFAMAVLAVGDMFVKLASRHMPLGQILLMLGVGGWLIFVAVSRLRGAAIYRPELWHPMVMLRNALEVVGAIGMVIGLAMIPLSIMAAILQSAPLIVTLGAAVVLREKVGPRRWAAVIAGLIGMLMVIRPFGASFTGWELFAVMGVTGLAARDVVTRLAPATVPSLFLSLWGVLSIAIPGGFMLLISGTPMVTHAAALWPILGAIVLTPIGYLSVTAAMRMAPASSVAPFRYSRLVFNTGLGIAVFGENLDLWTILGAGLILGSGLYVFAREAQIARASARG